MNGTTLEILKTMLEAGLARIKEIDEVGSALSSEQPEVVVEEESKTKKASTTKKSTAKKKEAELTTSEPTPAKEAKAEEPKTEEVTLEQIRAVLQEKRAQGKKDKFKALFESFGVQRLPDVDPADYAKLLTAAEAL